MQENEYMKHAFKQAQKAEESGEVPVGVLIVHADTGKILFEGHNQMKFKNDPTAHAEMVAIQMVCQNLKQERLEDYDIYVTLEPCAMCAAAISFARFKHLYFGAYDTKSGGVEHGGKFYTQKTCHHRPIILGGIMEKENRALIQKFFESKRG